MPSLRMDDAVITHVEAHRKFPDLPALRDKSRIRSRKGSDSERTPIQDLQNKFSIDRKLAVGRELTNGNLFC